MVGTLVEPFQRGTGRIRTDHSGVGLGLAIVRSIAEAHDGEAWSSRHVRAEACR
ncbi:ATP-binding protein [Nocardioides convexus]|uniref:ATP-binding protein n=1 Tax=Nocardioides convexus TaxID=2712224 RepID=UPI0024184FF9|nr:ATP-binding protein [Nocardioides convexus]